MKKKMLLGLLVTVPFLTACGNNGGSGNTMRCEYESKKEIQGYVFTFDGDKLTKIGLYESVDITNLSDDDLCTDKDSCIKLAKSNVSECEKDLDMESCRVETDDKSVIIIGDFKDYVLEEKKDYNKGMSKSEVKKKAESSGLTCR